MRNPIKQILHRWRYRNETPEQRHERVRAARARWVTEIQKINTEAETEPDSRVSREVRAIMDGVIKVLQTPDAGLIASRTAQGAPQEKCGKPAASLIPRMGMSYVCVLDRGHDGECKPGGTCFAHGTYVGTTRCPYPIEECVKSARAAQGAEKEER